MHIRYDRLPHGPETGRNRLYCLWFSGYRNHGLRRITAPKLLVELQYIRGHWGLFLIRGSLRAAQIVTRFSVFLLTASIGALFLLIPILQPIGLLMTQFRLDPTHFLTQWLMALLSLALLGWTYWQLRCAAVLEALWVSGHRTSRPVLAIGVGLFLVAMVAVIAHLTLSGVPGARATELARQKLGPGYQYRVQSIQWAGSRTSSVVAAYNRLRIPVRDEADLV